MSVKLFFFDTETTGVRFWKNGIHQISGMIVTKNEIKEQFDIKVQPFKDALIEDEALAVSSTTREMIANYMPFNDGYKKLISVLDKWVDRFNKKDKFFLVGYNNASFDDNFLRGFFKQNGDDYFGSWFWSSPIDVMGLAANKLKEVRHEMENFQLKTVAKYLGIEVDETKLHDASYDLTLTWEIYKKVNL